MTASSSETPRDGPSAKFAIHESVSIWMENAAGEAAGGDWCSVVPLSAQSVALTVGDVCGHGVAAAGDLAVVHAEILGALSRTQVPSDVLAAVNAVAYGADEASTILATAIVAVFDWQRRTLTFANAGHPPPLIFSATGHAILTHAPADLPLGVFARHDAANYVVALPPGALLVLYTDGITEHARDPVLGEQELIDAVRWVYPLAERDAAGGIAGRMLRPTRGDDDAAIMVVRLAPDGA